MKTYLWTEEPLKVFGIPNFYKNHKYERLPESVRDEIPSLRGSADRVPGVRVGFRTDATEFTVKVTLATLSPHTYLGRGCAQSVSVMTGDRPISFYAGTFCPRNYDSKTFQGTFYKSAVMEDVTLWLPRKEKIEEVEISFSDDGARVEAPTPYRYSKAVVYGCSTTEGCYSSTPTNDYISLLSRWFDMDYYNLGFSGSALGEPEMARYINTFKDEMMLFIYDYDDNAPDPEFLQNTHEPFFRIIREANPDLPVLFLSKPDFYLWAKSDETREIIRRTYERALAAGDKNVYFVDGETMFGSIPEDRYLCTVDGTHPNDLGFYRMASAIRPVMEKILASVDGVDEYQDNIKKYKPEDFVCLRK